MKSPKDNRLIASCPDENNCYPLKERLKHQADEIFKKLDEDYYYNNYDEKKTKRYEEIKKKFLEAKK